MELWDAYDASMRKVDGVTLVRGEPIPDGWYHLVSDVIVRHTDGSYLLVQRDYRKTWGGMWEATAGGSALLGETPLDCAIREVFEETGIRVSHIEEVGRVIHPARHAIYVEHFAVTSQDKDTIVLQEGETQDYKWVTQEELISMDSAHLVTQRMQLFVNELKGNQSS